jgi:hypothetical protein
LVVLGAAVLATGSTALAGGDPAFEKEAAVVTIVPGPAGPTAAETEKLEALALAAAARAALALGGTMPSGDAAPVAPLAIQPSVVEKAPEVSTIVQGRAGLTPAEQAKLAALRARAPAALPAPASNLVPAPADETK